MTERMPLPDCPACGSRIHMREILWGMPGPDVDESHYSLGGCLVTGDDPELRCLKCGWQGDWDECEPESDQT